MSTSTENANQELRAILMQELELQRQELQWQYRRVLDLNAVVLQNAGRLEIVENYLSNVSLVFHLHRLCCFWSLVFFFLFGVPSFSYNPFSPLDTSKPAMERR